MSTFRLHAAREIMERVRPDAVRGNLSEIRMLITGEKGKNGVDADVSDGITEQNKECVAEFVMQAARKLGCIVCATGAIDFVSDGLRCFAIYNGHEMMSKVTGTGCQLSAMVAAHLASCPKEKTEAAAAAVCMLGAAGEIAWEAMQPQDGNATYRNRMIDAVCCMTPEQLKIWEKIEIMEEKRGIQDEREQ
ncbi:MAG: hydroxyethylthiazole kinase [Eubacterium sp.]